MPKLTIGGTEIQGVIEANVVIVHQNPKAPDPIPIMEFDLTIRLQNSDMIPKWALAPQGPDRFKKVELIIQNSNKQPAHTWTLLNGYVANYKETEHPGDIGTGSGEGGFFLNLLIRGQILEAKDYTGTNVMTVAAGQDPKLPG